MVRLSEAMARAHCDYMIRPTYVKEVCRLLRNSNINISKADIEFEAIQEEINLDLQRERQMEDNQQQIVQPESQPQPATNKVKISFEEYQRLTFLIVTVMKEFEQ